MSAARIAAVTPAEAELLAVTRALFVRDGYAAVEPILAGPSTVALVGPVAMGVLQTTLARGAVLMLARLGGAVARRRSGDGPSRVFDVRRPPTLAFGSYAFELLRWLTVTALGAPRDPAFRPFTSRPASIADELVAYLVLRLVAGTRLEAAVAASPGLAVPLAWLGFARALARAAPRTLELAGLLADGDRATVVECLEGDLAVRWSAPWPVDAAVAPDVALRIGQAEHAVLDAYVAALGAAGRWDLAQPLLVAALRALPPAASPAAAALAMVPRLAGEPTLRSRSEARRASGALFAAVGRVARRREELAHVHFVDDGYEEAQALLAAWEIAPRDLFARAEAARSALASLDGLGEA